MVLGGTKRSAPVASPRAPKAKRTKTNGAVMQALKEATHLNESTREMLVDGLADCLAGRHPYQQKFLGFVLDALAGVESQLSSKISEAEQAAKAVAASAQERLDAQRLVSKNLLESDAIRKEADEVMIECTEALETAAQTLTNCEGAMHQCDVVIANAAMQRHQLEEIAAVPSSMTSPLVATLLARLLPGFEPTLNAELVERAINAEIAERDQAIRRSAAKRVALDAAVLEARESLEAAEQDLNTQRATLDEACARHYDHAAKLKAASDALRQLPEEKAKAEVAVKVCKQDLAGFRSGPLSLIRSKSQAAAIPKPAPVVSAQLVVESVGSATASRPDAARTRRRRMSWLPRKMLELRTASADKNATVRCLGKVAPAEILRAPTPMSSALTSADRPTEALTLESAVALASAPLDSSTSFLEDGRAALVEEPALPKEKLVEHLGGISGLEQVTVADSSDDDID